MEHSNDEDQCIKVYQKIEDSNFNTNDELIKAIRELNVNFEENGCIRLFYHGLRSFKNDIKPKISYELYDRFDVECRCVYYEHLYGDGEYSDNVVKDCMDVLDEIIDALILED